LRKVLIALLTLSSSMVALQTHASELPLCKPQVPGIADSILLNPLNPNDFAMIQFVGAVAHNTYESMIEIPPVESHIGKDKFLTKDGKNLSCSKWILKKGCVEYHCEVAFDDIKTGTARSEF
jgi:hypothetical protein